MSRWPLFMLLIACLGLSFCRGYAMRGSDAAKLSGAIIGKALKPLASGKGKIEVLVTLR